jgi:hypothetical protein
MTSWRKISMIFEARWAGKVKGRAGEEEESISIRGFHLMG